MHGDRGTHKVKKFRTKFKISKEEEGKYIVSTESEKVRPGSQETLSNALDQVAKCLIQSTSVKKGRGSRQHFLLETWSTKH
jgi:hypothetical protein